MKVIICGPPHSGKSVFIYGLCKVLERSSYFLFRACPDGEGSWTYRYGDNSNLRRKGDFDEAFMHYVLDGLTKCSVHVPITLVDVGGVRSPENEEIFRHCDAFVVLSSDDDEMAEWKKFGEESGAKCLALLKSDLHGENTLESDTVPVMGTVAGLERGECIISPVHEALGRVLSKIAEAEAAAEMKENSMESIITVDSLAEAIGKVKEPRQLPNGQDIMQMLWTGEDLRRLMEEMYRDLSSQPGKYVLDGPAPAWMALGFIHGCHPQAACLYDPRLGSVEIVGRKTSFSDEGEGKNLKFKVEEAADFTLVEFEIEGGTFDVADLGSVRAPQVNQMKGVVLSGRGPNWLTAQLGMAYHTARWVACWQPGQGATVAMSHHPERKLGEIIVNDLVVAARETAS